MNKFFTSITTKIKELYIKIGQLIYLTSLNFYENNLFESINSCAFGFIFSFIPIILIILAILSGVLNSYPSLEKYVSSFVTDLQPVIDIEPIIQQIKTTKSLSFVEIILGIWVIWMARKLFSSVLQAINKIFHLVNQRTTWFNQIFVFLLEFVLVFAILLIVMTIFIMNKIIGMPFFQELEQFLPIALLSKISSNVTLITNITLFMSSTIIFRMASGVKPKYYLCALYAAIATVSFHVVSLFLKYFINTTNYNIVYGTISSIILLMMQVWFFFIIFLFCAQMLYCTVYREVLSLGCLYMMPEESIENESTWKHFKRNLFRRNPTRNNKYETVNYNPGDVIFSKGEESTCVYYIRSGTIHRHSENFADYLNQGAFFGEMHCILNQPRTSTALACTPCTITKIKTNEFLEILHTYPKAASKAVSKVSKYTSRDSEIKNDFVFDEIFQ